MDKTTIMAKRLGTIPIPPSPELMLKYQLHIVRNGQKLIPTLIRGGGGGGEEELVLSQHYVIVASGLM